MKIVFSVFAAKELDDAVDWYEDIQVGLGSRFGRTIHDTLSRILKHPKLNSEISKGIYRAIVKKFPYGIIYSIEDDEIIVLAIAHFHRKPNYWQD